MDRRQPVCGQTLGIELLGSRRVAQQRPRAVRTNTLANAFERSFQPHRHARGIHNVSVLRIDVDSATKGDYRLRSLRNALQVFTLEFAEARLAEARKDLADGQALRRLDFRIQIQKRKPQLERKLTPHGALPCSHKTHKVDTLHCPEYTTASSRSDAQFYAMIRSAGTVSYTHL